MTVIPYFLQEQFRHWFLADRHPPPPCAQVPRCAVMSAGVPPFVDDVAGGFFCRM